MKKEYPAFIIDRSRRSQASRFSDDFVVCTDRECGFIAKAYKLPNSRRDAHIDALVESGVHFAKLTIGNATVILEVVRFLYEPVAHVSRVPPLLRKAMKAYVYSEAADVPSTQGYAAQIAALEDVLRMSEAQRPRLVDMNGEKATDAFVDALRGARESVALLAKIVKSEKS